MCHHWHIESICNDKRETTRSLGMPALDNLQRNEGNSLSIT